MNKKEFLKKIILLKKYAHNVLKIKRMEISKRVVFDYYDPEKKTIGVSFKGTNYKEVINSLLHEMGHAYEDVFYSHRFNNVNFLNGLNKVDMRRNLDYDVDRMLAEMIANGEVVKKSLIKVLNKRIEDVSFTKKQLKQWKKFKKTLSPDSELAIVLKKLNNKKKMNMTPSQKQAIVKREIAAWEYGEMIAECVGIELDKQFFKEKENNLETYMNY